MAETTQNERIEGEQVKNRIETVRSNDQMVTQETGNWKRWPILLFYFLLNAEMAFQVLFSNNSIQKIFKKFFFRCLCFNPYLESFQIITMSPIIKLYGLLKYHWSLYVWFFSLARFFLMLYLCALL